MTKTTLATDILLYTFPSDEPNTLVNNIMAVLDGSKALLVDAAYDDEMKQVLEDLTANGITVEAAVVSHFHEDHYDGLSMLPDITIYGNDNYIATLAYDSNEADAAFCTPTHLIINPTTINFGKHTLEIIPAPGHSKCTLLTKINGQFIHIADEVLLSLEGKLALPWLCDGETNEKRQRQLNAWCKLKQIKINTIIPAHGPAFESDKLAGYIQNLEKYLTAIIQKNGHVTYEDAVKYCDYPLIKENWHENNCK
ncbi:MAG: MBL fold metallo-hydrolase [Defluviitaleaceae bacterium]|nr:MBL fold metallo-hydrolase [Defluviitaleaceae bacterium]